MDVTITQSTTDHYDIRVEGGCHNLFIHYDVVVNATEVAIGVGPDGSPALTAVPIKELFRALQPLFLAHGLIEG